MSNIDKDTNVFTYGRAGSVLPLLPLVMFYITFPILLLGIIAVSLSIVFRLPIEIADSGDPWTILIILGAFLFILMVVDFTIINQYNKVQVLKGGLRIRIFTGLFNWKFLPWEDIIRIEKSPRVDRWRLPVWVLKVKRLTYWHQLLSKLYRTDRLPGIMISSDMKGSEELLKIIRDHLPGNE
jgi:hypothetical protein